MDIYREIKESKIPTYIYGAGCLGETVLHALGQYGIIVKAFIVDTLYFKENQYLKNIPIVSWDTLKDANINVVLGFSNYLKCDKIKRYACVNKVYCIPFTGYGNYSRELTPKDYSYIEEQMCKVIPILADDFSKGVLTAFTDCLRDNDVSHIFDYYEKEQSYFDNSVFKIGEDEVFYDIGAYDGDTLREFWKVNNFHYKKVIAIEADKNNYARLIKTVNENNQSRNVICLNCGVWEQSKQYWLNPRNDNSQDYIVSEKKEPQSVGINMNTIDGIWETNRISPTFIKTNFLGALETLKGARLCIEKCTPKIAIICGFNLTDLLETPLMIKQICSAYKVYYRYKNATPERIMLLAEI